MTAIKFPTYEEALYLHERLIGRFGGDSGLRDPGLLESALVRPQSGYYETLAHQAAALLQSLARNHCFVDGNKRIAWALAAVFLRLNGWKLVVEADVAERFLIDEVIVGHCEVDDVAAWLQRHMRQA
jgi:death-on-curing protein